MFRMRIGLALYAVINDGSPNSSMFSHRIVTLNLPIQSAGIEAGPPLSPPSPPLPIAADSKSAGNNDEDGFEDEDEEDILEEAEEVLDGVVDEVESFLGGAAFVKYSTSNFREGGAFSKSARALTVSYVNAWRFE